MVYSTAEPPALTAGPLAGLGGQRWVFFTNDTPATVAGASYFTNGVALGMRLGDEVLIINKTTFVIATARVITIASRAVTVEILVAGRSNYTVSTTDATVTTLALISIPTGTQILFTAYVRAIRTGGASGTPNDAGGYVLHAIAKNVAGTVTIIGQSAALTAEDQAAWGAVFDSSGSTARIRVTGATGNNIDWTAIVLGY